MRTKTTTEQRQSWRERLESLLSCHDTVHAEFTLAVLDDLDAAEARAEESERQFTKLAEAFGDCGVCPDECPLHETEDCDPRDCVEALTKWAKEE